MEEREKGGRGTGEAIKKENHLSSGCSLCVTQITQYKLDIGLGGTSYQTIISHNNTQVNINLLHIQLENRVNAVPLATGCMHIQTAHHSPRLTPQCSSYHSSTEVQLIPVQLRLSQPHDQSHTEAFLPKSLSFAVLMWGMPGRTGHVQ